VVRFRRLLGLWLTLTASAAGAATDHTTVQIALNQSGYTPGAEKIALVQTNRDLVAAAAVARVIVQPGGAAALPDVGIGADRKRYGKFRHHYSVDFSALATPGTYTIEVRDGANALLAVSPPTVIAADPLGALIPGVLRFFGVQRSGNTAPLIHAPSHLTDGVAVGGPQDGQAIDLSGGWYDAGDYIKFSLTIAYASFMQLFALRELAPATLDPTLRDAIRAEARVGLEYLLKAHPSPTAFYFQVADGRDHDAGFRLPEDDVTYGGPRPAYYGIGANLAGKAAAALALGAMEWAGDDPTFAGRCRTAAVEIDALGNSIAAGAATDPKQALLVSCVETPQEYAANRLNCGFYNEDSWRDDMTLAAVELYDATGSASYLSDAIAYGSELEPAYASLGLLNLHDEAFYALYPHLPVSGTLTRDVALARLRVDADRVRNRAAKDAYDVGQRAFLWGSSADIAGDAITCVLAARLSGDAGYLQTAQRQLDFLLGRNPFGVSLVAGAGTVYPLHPHHQVAELLPGAWYMPGTVIGSVAGGPARRSQYPFRADPDLKASVLADVASPFAPFENPRFLYHDITADYVSNEPALDSNSNVLGALLGVMF
jgi:endoglucanase